MIHLSRREFLLGAASTLLLPSCASAFLGEMKKEKSLKFYNTHTGESLNTIYWANGSYVEEGLQEINRLLRDHRVDRVHAISPKLLDVLYRMQGALGHKGPYEVICGYRCPATNAMLARRSGGVAKNSLHMSGKAVDIRVSGVCLKKLRAAALKLQAGGVGYYPKSNFVHVDVRDRVVKW